jgi:hypothetical protein
MSVGIGLLGGLGGFGEAGVIGGLGGPIAWGIGAVIVVGLVWIACQPKPLAVPQVRPAPTGNCGPGQYSQLWRDVQNSCKWSGEPQSCTTNMSCNEILLNLVRFGNCAGARRRINQSCYGGGDKGHREQYKNMLNGIANCVAKLKAKKC